VYGVCDSYVESCDGTLTYEELLATYKELYDKDLEIYRILGKQRKTINKLMTEKEENLDRITELSDEITQLNSQLENMKRQVRMLNSGTDVLNEILEIQNQGKPKGIGFNYNSLNNKQQVKEIKFLPAASEYVPTSGKKMLKRSPQHHGFNARRPHRWVCHHCGKKGHIRPFCFKLHGYPKWYQHEKKKLPKVVVPEVRKEWKPKTEEASLIAHISLRASSRES
jgi:hypothetical protein